MKHTLEGIAETRDVWLDGKRLYPQDSQRVINHSPDGFNWGYGGSGPAQLALAVVLKLTGSPNGHQDFKWKYISPLPMDRNFKFTFEL